MNAVIRRFGGICLALGISLSANAAITGSVKTIGGYGAGYRDGDNLVSQFRSPRGLVVNSIGLVFVADYGNNRIRVVDPSTEVTGTFASGMSGPVALAIDVLDRVYVVNNSSGTIDRLDSSGTVLTPFGAGLADPTAIALENSDGSGNIWVAESGGRIVRFPSNGSGLSNGQIIIPGAGRISGLALLVPGLLVASDSANHVIWSVPIGAGSPSVLAGSVGIAGFADGPGNTALFNTPQHIAISTNGVIVVADQKNHRVRAVNNVGAVTTLYGVNPATWAGRSAATLPGWTDGDAATAEMRDPYGVAVGKNNAVFDSEIFYHLIRVATGLSFPTNVSSTNPPDPGSTNQPPIPPSGNRITLGFASGEASSEFVGHPGQHFIAPVTLSIVSNTTIYGMQMNLTVSNTLAIAQTAIPMTFHSHLTKPGPIPGTKVTIPPKAYIETSSSISYLTNVLNTATGLVQVVTAVENSVGFFASLVFTNASGNMLGVGWLERFGKTNLYSTIDQELISTSQAHDHEFAKSNGKVIVGSFGFRVPSGALDDQYLVRIGRPSANGDGVESDVVIDVPNDPDGGFSAVRPLSIASRPYLVGDVLPFRWFNAGDFGDLSILNNDIQQIHQSASYRLNTPPPPSDMYDALDSCCFAGNGPENTPGSNLSDPAIFSEFGIHELSNAEINTIAYGDGVLNLADIFVTYRRSLDPDLTNYIRYWTNRVQGGVTVSRRWAASYPNLFRGTVGDGSTTVKKKTGSGYNLARATEPVTAKVVVRSRFGQPGATARVPVEVNITGPLSARSLRLRIKVSGLNGTANAAATFTPSLGLPWQGGGFAGDTLDVTWFEMESALAAGFHQIGTINIPIPADANADSLYQIKLENAEVAAGVTMFPTTTEDGIVILPARTTEPWDDAIPDEWRMQYFGSVNDIMSGPDADADGDGFTTLQEYLAGTNPLDETSLLAVSAKRGVSAVVLNWSTTVGKTYKLESSPSLTNPTWTVVEQGIVGNGGVIQRARPLDSLERFFRVSAQ